MQMDMYETHYVNGQIKRWKKIMLIKSLKFSCWKALVKLGIFNLFDGHLGLQIHTLGNYAKSVWKSKTYTDDHSGWSDIESIVNIQLTYDNLI